MSQSVLHPAESWRAALQCFRTHRKVDRANGHENAGLTWQGRRLLVERIAERVLAAAESAAGVSLRTARKWLAYGPGARGPARACAGGCRPYRRKSLRRNLCKTCCAWALALGCVSAADGQGTGPEPPLPPPRLQGGMSVEQALQQRRSVRRFAATALPLQQVAQLLWAAQGITHASGLRTAPSAGALQPLEVYLLAMRVQGLAPGLYHYAPASHALKLLQGGEADAALAAAVPGQGWLREAPAVLLLAADVARTAQKYGARAPRYVHIEAGSAAQNVYLQATAIGLGTVLVGAFDDKALQGGLGLPAAQAPLVLMPVGLPR